VKKLRALVCALYARAARSCGATEKEIEEWRTEYYVIKHLKRRP